MTLMVWTGSQGSFVFVQWGTRSWPVSANEFLQIEQAGLSSPVLRTFGINGKLFLEP